MGAYTLLQDLTVTTNSTSVVLNDFGTITKDDFVKVVFTHVNSSGSQSSIAIYPNNETSSVYTLQTLNGIGSSVGAGRGASNRIAVATANGSSKTFAFIKLSENDRFNCFANCNEQIASSLRLQFDYCTSSGATFTSGITSFTFTANVTSSIGTGSRIQIYKLDAVKVADITVASNTTQVDISSLSIDKDSEYLLVSDVVSAASGFEELRLFVNDNTTLTNYFVQRIIGNGTNAIALRSNRPDFIQIGPSNSGLSYIHIKLSNIGAYTYQSYALEGKGSTTPTIDNYFGSSTAENITSITKLNIVAGATNAIGSGTRFTLYKLYE